MTHMRYWTMSIGAAVSGAFIAIDRFAFAPNHALWIAFGVAIAAAVFSLAATGVALVRDNQAFSGLGALSALVAGWTIIATRVFSTPTALWLAFAGGIALLLLSLRALALHETTVERVVHALELNGAGEPLAVRPASTGPMAVHASAHSLRDRIALDAPMRSWIYWLTHTGIALAGAFVVLATFAWPAPVQTVSPRWLAFAVGVGAVSMAFISLGDRALAARSDGWTPASVAAILITGASAVIAAGLIVLMATLQASDTRWWAFGLGAALAGVSLLALTVHELTSERVRHTLEIARAATPTGETVPASVT